MGVANNADQQTVGWKVIIAPLVVALLVIGCDVIGPKAKADIGNVGLENGASPVRTLWPRYPQAKQIDELSAVALNGVLLLTESWEVPGDSQGVLDYFSQQMSARGWLDVTAAEYDMKQEWYQIAQVIKDRQSPFYREVDQQVVESTLVLSKEPWTVQITLGPAPAAWRSRVFICAAKVASFAELTEKINASAKTMLTSGQMQKCIEVDEFSSKGGCQTCVLTAPGGPFGLFNSALAKMRSKNWRSVWISTARRLKNDGYFALLAKAQKMICLAVTSSLNADMLPFSTMVMTKMHEG